MLTVKRFTLGPLETNSYVVICRDQGAIIDPAAEGQMLLDELDGCVLKYVILTHAHADHMGAIDLTASAAEIFALHEEEVLFYDDPSRNGSDLLGLSQANAYPSRLLRDGDNLSLGDKQIRVIHTPGHSPGGICLLLEEILFSGDTLFAGTVGRTDLTGGSQAMLMSSLRSLASLPRKTKVYPGHGPTTVMDREMRCNRFLSAAADGF